MPSRDSYLLLGQSKRAVERRVFGERLKVLIDRDADPVTRNLVRAYSRAWGSMRRTVDEVAETAATAKHESRLLSPREIARIDRVDRGMFALERQVRELSRFTGVQVKGGATSGLGRVVANVLDATPGLAGIDRRFTKPSGAAMEGLILRSTSRIEASTRALDARGQIALKEGLFRGLVLGENPRDTAKQIVDSIGGAFFGGLNRAKTLARTEIADAHRYATRLAYADSELVVGWKWLASLNGRTCPACWAQHNTFHEKTEMMFAHQNCRCTQVPVLADDMPYDNDLGDPEEIFWGLPREEQLAIMGPGRLKALEGGARFTDLTYLKNNPGWRPSQAVTSVADLQGIAELNIATTPGDVISVPGLTNESILSYAFAQGGLTINTITGDQPTSGFVVARKGTSLVVDAREFFGPAGPNAVAQWLTAHGDRLDDPGAHMGMWYDTANGKVVLDVVEILDDRDAAIALGRSEDQIAIFDLDTFSEIPTGGSGGYTDSISSALTAEQVKGIKAGDTITVVQDGVEKVVTVTEGSTSGRTATVGTTADGEVVHAWPDQIVRRNVSAESEADRIEGTQEQVRRVVEETGIDAVNLSALSVDTARRVADAMIDVEGDWKELDPAALGVGDAAGAFAVTNTAFPPGGKALSAIDIDRSYATQPSAWQSDMQAAEDRGHFHRGTSDDFVDYTVDHEMGHVAEFRLFGHPGSAAGHKARIPLASDIFNSLMPELEKIDPADPEKANEQLGRAFANPAFMSRIEEDLSGYGITSLHEMFAEGFAVYRDHGPGESIVADTVMRHFARRYHEIFGKWPHERDLDKIIPEYDPA